MAAILTIDREQQLPAPLEQVFAFFAEATNLERLTPPWLRFKILNPGVALRPGARIDYRLRIRGVPVRWQSEITEWQPPFRFVDVQTRGPYRMWRHEHTFASCDQGTLVTDRVRYVVPGGRLVASLFVTPDVRRIFDYRAAQLQAIFSNPDGRP